ncbi:unnamed protein product [marine sediment metagenome]|uniref:Uncharacterized protein n=1 Tax=marine sediment metagenome TaxID=412755 RepID=X1RVC2_9ZZZZ
MVWTVKQDCIDDIVSNYEASRDKCNLAWQDLDEAERFNNMSLFKTAIEHLIEAVNYNLYATYYILVRNTAYTPNYAVPYFFTNHTDGVLTMSDILEAMKNAKPHQPLLFMGYLEAYKASVWNATFDETFFADLVRKWLIWG